MLIISILILHIDCRKNIIIKKTTMLTSIKNKLSNNFTSQSIVSELSDPAFVHNLTAAQLEQLTKIVQGKIYNYKLPVKVITTIYTILVMKNYKDYNTKLAIQVLSKFYRNLSSTNEHPKQSNQIAPSVQHKTPSSKTKKVIANILIRIPTFSNYKMIIKDLSPELVSMKTILTHRTQIYKQCPNLYKEQLVKQHKYIWYRLMQDDYQNYPLDNDFKNIRNYLQELINIENVVELYKKFTIIQKLIKFIRNRINKISMNKQQINIESLCEDLSVILSYKIQKQKQQQRKLLPNQLKLRQQLYIKSIKNSSLQLLRLLLIKLKLHFHRKFVWLTNITNELINRYYDQYSIQPRYLISFCRTFLHVYGIGSFDFDKFIYNQDSILSLSTLISALCYNNYQSAHHQSNLVNYQNQKSSKTQKTKQIHINLYNTTLIDSAYEAYLKTTSKSQRQILLQQILRFIKKYYAAKQVFGMELLNNQHIFGVLDNSKNTFSEVCRKLIEQIKTQVIYKGYQRINQNIEQFCNNIFINYIKRKKEPKLTIQRTQQFVIEPTSNPNLNPNDRSKKKQGSLFQDCNFSLSAMSMKPNISMTDSNAFANLNRQEQISEMIKLNHQGNQLRKTHSFDLELQGWSAQKKSQNSMNKQKEKRQIQKSQMFYSIKECSVLDQKQIQQLKLPENENQFVLTPQF